MLSFNERLNKICRNVNTKGLLTGVEVDWQILLHLTTFFSFMCLDSVQCPSVRPSVSVCRHNKKLSYRRETALQPV